MLVLVAWISVSVSSESLSSRKLMPPRKVHSTTHSPRVVVASYKPAGDGGGACAVLLVPPFWMHVFSVNPLILLSDAGVRRRWWQW